MLKTVQLRLVFGFLVTAFLSISNLAVQQPKTSTQTQVDEARTIAGCGPKNVEFDVKAEKKQHPLPKPDAGKAMIYVILEKITQICIGGCDTFRVGVDGNWIGANRDNSYFYFPADPGDHNLCTDVQPRALVHSKLAAASSLTAEAGKTYFFLVKYHQNPKQINTETLIELEPLDNAEGSLLVSSRPLATFHQKK